MLNTNTQSVLKSILPINNSFIMSYPKMTIVDEFKTVMGMIDMEKLGDEFEEIGIFDGAKFLGALDLMQDATFTLNNNIITAKDETSSMNFLTSSPSSLEDVTAKESIFETTIAAPSVTEFDITSDTLSRVKKAAGIFKTMNALFLTCVNGTVTMRLGAKETFNISDNSYSIGVDTTTNTSKDFELPIPLENVMKLPNVDYTVHVKYNEERDVYRVLFMNDLYTFLFTLMK